MAAGRAAQAAADQPRLLAHDAARGPDGPRPAGDGLHPGADARELTLSLTLGLSLSLTLALALTLTVYIQAQMHASGEFSAQEEVAWVDG